MAKPCRRCGGEKGRLPYGPLRVRARYCESCQNAVDREWQEKVPYHCGSTADDHWHLTCPDCAANKTRRLKEATLRGAATRRRNNANWAKPVHAEAFWQRKAMSMVAAAKKQGLLPALDGSIACVDCGKPAREYDHRDYSRPLDVQPVCRSCNKKRGTAKWPSADQFRFELVRPRLHAATLSSERGRIYVQGEIA